MGSVEDKVNEYTLSTAFDFSPVTTVIDGIEVKVYSNKKSRIVDSTIQLAQAGTVIGTNKAVAASIDSSAKTGERYLPSAAIKALTPAEYAATSRAKRKGTKKGKQHVKQPKNIAKKVRKYR